MIVFKRYHCFRGGGLDGEDPADCEVRAGGDGGGVHYLELTVSSRATISVW